jgi:hypothetical protein
MVMYILDGAQGADATIVANKTTAAVSFTAALDTADEQVAFVNAVLAAPGANAGTTTLAAVGATTTADEITALVTSGITQATDQAAAAAINEVALSASATVRTFTGTAGKDKFVATLADSLKDGDKIVGSLESDTLDLRSNGQNGSTILTTMDGVETVVLNNRSATTLDVGQWSGVTLFEVAATSSGGATLTLNNAEHATTIALNDSVSALIVNFEDTTGANDTVRLNLGNLGSTTQESLTFAGNNEAVVITASGTASILLDASAEAITVSGSGRLTLDLGGDLVSSVNASTLADGGLTLRVSASDTITITGTSTGDTFTFTNALTSADVINGGLGTDTLSITALTSATSGNVTRPGVTGTTNVETLTINASGIEYAVTLSSAAFSTINLAEASATTTFNVLNTTPGTQVAIQSMTTAGGAVVVAYSGTDAVDVGSIVLSGSATNTATTVRVSGVDTATISAAGSGTKTFANISVDGGAETVSLTQGKSGNLTVTTLLVSGTVTDLTFGATDNGELTVNGLDRDQSSSFDRLNVTNLAVTTSGGSGTVTLSPAMSFNSGLAKVTITGSNSSDVYLGVISANEGAVIDLDVVLTGEAGLGANGGQGLSIYINNSGSIDANIAVGSGIAYATAINAGAASGSITGLSITVGASGTYVGGGVAAKTVAASTLTANAEGSLTLGGIDADSTVGLVTIAQTSSGLVSVGNVTGSGIAGLSVTLGQTSTVTVGSITDGKTFGTITGTLGKDADLTLDVLTASGTTTTAGFGGVAISDVGASATVNLGSATIAGTTASIGIGDISVSGTTNVRIDLEGLRATATIGSLTLTAGTSGTIAVSGITSDTKSIGNISLTMGAGGVISVGDIQAVSSTIGTVSINGASATTIAGLMASAIGNITLGSGNTTVSGEFVATNFGDITINTDRVDLNVSALAATNITMGAVIINGSGVTFDVGSAQGSVTMASLTVSNTSGTTNIDLGSAAAVTAGIVLNAGGSVVLDLSSGAAAQTVYARASANTIYLSTKGDTIELAPSTGVDRVYIDRAGGVSASAGLTESTIRGFDFASSTTEDKIYLGGSASLFGLLSASTYGASAHSTDALNVVFLKSAGEGLAIDNENGAVMSATQVIIVGTGVDAGSIVSALKWIGANLSATTTAVASAAQVGVMFYNASGQNTQLWVVGLSADLATTFTASVGHEVDLLATFDTDIARFSGSTFNDTFNHG